MSENIFSFCHKHKIRNVEIPRERERVRKRERESFWCGAATERRSNEADKLKPYTDDMSSI